MIFNSFQHASRNFKKYQWVSTSSSINRPSINEFEQTWSLAKSQHQLLSLNKRISFHRFWVIPTGDSRQRSPSISPWSIRLRASGTQGTRPRVRKDEREGNQRWKKGRGEEKRKGTEEIPRAVDRPRGCRPHCPRHGHVPNNSLGTRKQLLRNSCYRATLRVYISRCPFAGRAFHVLWVLNLLTLCLARARMSVTGNQP